MTAGKKKNGNHADPFQLLLNGVNINEINGRSKMKEEILNDGHDENEKEIIRRLKIQNKKLLQQVSSLRKQVKQRGTGKKQMTDSADKQPRLEIRIEFLE
jgi:hypothetical protein